MDNVFLMLVAFSLMVGALGLMAVLELIVMSIAESKHWREMPRGTVPMLLVKILSIMGAGSLMGLLCFCVFTVLGWTGIIAAVGLGVAQWLCISYIEHREEYLPPMATRKEIESLREVKRTSTKVAAKIAALDDTADKIRDALDGRE